MRQRLIQFLLVILGCCVIGLAQEKGKGDADGSLIGGRLRYTPPPGDDWERAENVKADDAAAYARRDDQGAIAIQVLPTEAEITPQIGGAVIRSLRDAHKKADQKILFGPKIEPDSRFALKVHEKYQSGDKVADEIHLYRNVGPRVVMATVNAWTSDESETQKIHKAGEEMLASTKWSPAAKK